MTACPDKEDLLQALLDGELDAANAKACETHLKTCGGCARAFGRLQDLRARLAAAAAHPAPESLRTRITAQLAEPEPSRRRPRIGASWALGTGVAALAASLALVAIRPVAPLEDELVSSHIRSTLAGHLVDVETSDRHVVKPWFNGRVDFAPPVPELAAAGYPLVGGRLDYVHGRVVAAVVYRRNRHVINLFAWPASVGPDLTRMANARNGYAVTRWRERGLEFWAVSDIDPADLEAFRRAFISHAGP